MMEPFYHWNLKLHAPNLNALLSDIDILWFAGIWTNSWHSSHLNSF